MRFCTIASAAYGAQVCVAAESCEEVHPDSSFTWITFGAMPDWRHEVVPPHVKVVRAEDVVSDFEWRAFAYDVFELGTSVKPQCFLHLLDESDDELVFVDPDVWFRSPLDSVERAFMGNDILLTPHLLSPGEAVTLSFRDACRYGAYNLGFLGLQARPQARACMHWWEKCAFDACTRAVESGVYMDQRWADLVPSLFAEAGILRDAGVNVAWWNAFTRDWASASLIHFSGFDPSRPDRVTRHRRALHVRDLPRAAWSAFEGYREALERYSVDRWRAEPYTYGQLSDGNPIPYTLRVLFRARGPRHTAGNFDAKSSFARWAVEGNAHEPSPLLRTVRQLLPEAPLDESLREWLAAQAADPGLAAPRFADALVQQSGQIQHSRDRPRQQSPVWERCECGRPRPDGQVEGWQCRRSGGA